ncbi:MAG: CotH kinase family protein [Vicinamibacterales bacterium]
MSMRAISLEAGLVLVTLLGVSSPLAAQTAEDFFNDQVLQTLEITIHSRDWNDLRANDAAADYYPADLSWNGLRMRNVGIRSRGLGSRYGPKPGLELSFDHYASRQRFLGLRSIVLDNLVTDASMLRESVAMAFLRRMGVPASRESHARVFVNGEYIGTYASVEAIDTVFVERAFGEAGSLYEFRWTYPYFGTFLGESLDPYRTLFDPRNLTTQSTFELYTPVRDLFKTINQAPDATFADDVDKVLDLNSLIRLVAADALLAELDGFLGYAGMNNVYLSRIGQRARFLPWDKDHAFHAADYPILAGASENALMGRVLNDPSLRASFFAAVNEAAFSAASGNWLVLEIVRQYVQIRDAALADELKPFSNTDFENAVAELLAFAQSRPGFVVGEVQRLR